MFKNLISHVWSRAWKGLLLILAPLITIWILWSLYTFVTGFTNPVLVLLFGEHASGVVGLVGLFALLYFLGSAVMNSLAKAVMRRVDSVVDLLPLVRNIYSTTRKTIALLDTEGGAIHFNKVALVQFSHEGCWAVGFVTRENISIAGKTLCAVQIAHTPLPYTGLTLLFEPKHVLVLDMSPEDALQFAVSMGLIGKDVVNIKHELKS